MRRLGLVGLAMLALAHAASAQEPVVFVEDRAVLTALEDKGYGFEDLFGKGRKSDLAGLYAKSPAYHTIVETIGADIGALRAEMKAAGRPTYEQTTAEVGRAFDMRWLKSDATRMRLVGVVNRLDRRDFTDMRGEGGCGEVRLIYRLAYSFKYKNRTLASRMPFDFNAVYTAEPDADGGCTGVAGRWMPQVDDTVDAAWLAGGVLDKAHLTFKQLELNTQVTRFPSGEEPGFGGQAAYLMRIFGIDGDTVTEQPLENTPDQTRLSADAGLKARLAAYVRDNVASIDTGVYEIPGEFLATKVISFSTFGSARQGNHPFLPLLDAGDLAGIDYSGLKLLRSPQALVERLDNGSCQGCHQSGSTAGFHFIGLDDATTSPLNRIEVGVSPHFHAEIPRRIAYVEAVTQGGTPNRFRPLSSGPPAKWDDGRIEYLSAEITMSCHMPGDARKFADDWQCGSGTVCTTLSDAPGMGLQLAQCLLPKDSEAMFSGHPCLTGEISAGQSQPYNDSQEITGQFAAFEPAISRTKYTCRPPRIGVPGGIAYRNCTKADRSFAAFKPGQPMPNEVCALVGGKKFDLCVATGDFDQCLGGAVNRGNRPACSADHFCREDYMCQSLPPDIPGKSKIRGIGFCSPTYFIFQMRVDNHLTPWGAKAAVSASAITRAREPEPMYRSVEVDQEGVDEAQ